MVECRGLLTKEHFHCVECDFKVVIQLICIFKFLLNLVHFRIKTKFEINNFKQLLARKDELMRHLKWHEKRAESFQFGFERFAPTDDCVLRFGPGCPHNRAQTHYHCLQV